MASPVEIAVAFNDAINRADATALGALMSDDHRFVDSAGSAVEGRDAFLAAWRSFFQSFPGYRNVFDTVGEHGDGDGVVVAVGRSECSFEPLDGPARWYATVADGLVTEWRVEDPAPPTADG